MPACAPSVSDPACAEGVHPERLRKLAREGGRYTAQHLRALSPLRRRATLVATVLDTATRLTDEGVALFDRAVGRMFRRAEVREEQAVLRRLGPLFLDALQLRAVPAATSTLRAVELLHTVVYASGGRTWPKSLPISFLRPTWRSAVLDSAAKGHVEHRRTWEAAVLLALRDRLRGGDIWVEGSRQWRAVEDQLISPPLFTAMREAGPLPVAVPETTQDYLAERRILLERRLAEVNVKAEADALEDVRIRGDELKISPLKAVTPEEAEVAAERLYGALPSTRVTELLLKVHRWTGFADCFTHLHTGLLADDPRVVITALLADATNMGLTRMADACALASYKQLAWTAGWYLREDTYRSALAVVAKAQQTQPLAALFGGANVPSLDGQHFLTAGPGEALGAHNARYGHERSALIYTHTSARHAPFHAVAIPPVGEAAYVIDGLFHHEADLSTLTHHTDGGGVSDHNFALTALLGVRFAPRIPNIADRKLYAFGPASSWPTLAPFIAGRPDEKLITAHWADVLRFTCSVRTGAVSASLMLRRLGAYPRQNGLALALREVGRIERTLRTLDWIELPPLRRQTTVELNKGESRHALARAVAFHRLGRLRDRTAAMLQHRASALALVTGAIALWNTVYLGQALDALRSRGEGIPDTLLAHLAPSGWQHINLTGDYLWGADGDLGPDWFRPLRNGATSPWMIAA